jgi:hypothetical protein
VKLGPFSHQPQCTLGQLGAKHLAVRDGKHRLVAGIHGVKVWRGVSAKCMRITIP